MIRALLIALILLIGSGGTIAQTNLVLNGDFEQHSDCPQNNDNIDLANYWSGIDTNKSQFMSCIPDYCHVCAPNSSTNHNNVPSSVSYWQYPHSGNGMAQVRMFNDETSPFSSFKRDYLQGRLSQKLKAGKQYCVSFYVNLTEYSKYGIKEISAYLDNGRIDSTSTCANPQTQVVPQVTNRGGVITDTMGWTRIEGSFIAKGNEEFITIGNFKDKAHTTYTAVGANAYNSSQPWFALYLVDDVSVTECTVGIDNLTGKAQQYALAPNPGKGLITLSQSIEDGRGVSIAVLEATGKMIYHSTLHFEKGNATLDLSSLPQGVYFLKLSDAEVGSSVLRFVKE